MYVPRQETITLPLPPTTRSQLLSAGFRTTHDFARVTPVGLAQGDVTVLDTSPGENLNLWPALLYTELGISTEEALEILKVADPRYSTTWRLSGARSAQDLYEVQKSAKKIVTFCADLDRVLGGGVATGHITEFCGVPGVGKTQIGIQLCVDVQIPPAFGGLGGSAVYIDTEGSFTVERAVDMAGAAVQHMQAVAARRGGVDMQQQVQGFTVDSLLDNIFYFRLHDYVQQLALVQMLDQFVQQHPQVRLVVLDSVTFHFRQELRDMAQRAALLAQMAQDCMRLAEKYGIAVVFMNQVTTKVLDDHQAKLVPALGESWGHAASTRVILYWQQAERCAYVYKSPCLPPSTAQYTVTAEGVRSVRPDKRPTEGAGVAPRDQAVKQRV